MPMDYRNSVAQLDVDFLTEIQVTTNPGENYMRTGVYIDKRPEYIVDDSQFVPVVKDGATVVNDFCVITKDNYSEICGGRLLTWMTDLFVTGNPFQVILFRFGPDGGISLEADFTQEVKDELENLVTNTKGVCFHKTCLSQTSADMKLNTPVLAFFAKILKTDKLLNDVPRYPHFPSTIGVAASDPLYAQIKNSGDDCYMCYHADDERNASLFYLGQCLSGLNSSGTPVGDNGGDTNLITPSGQPDPDTAGFEYSDWEDYNLSNTQQIALETARIGFFKTVGNGTGRVVARGGNDDTINGTVFQANWIVNYCNYVNKVRVAEIISRKGVLRNANTYSDILAVMMGTIRRFGDEIGSGRLSNIVQSAPSFAQLPPSSGKEIVVPNAWSAVYVFNLRRVRVYGTLIIGM